jgi:hypothetical protein
MRARLSARAWTLCSEACSEERQARDVGGVVDGARGGRGIPTFPVVAAIEGDAGVQVRRALGESRDRVDHEGPRRVVHRYRFGAILRSRRRRRDDDGDGLADVTHAVRRQGIPRRLREGRAVAAPDAAAPLGDQRRDRSDAIGHEIAPGEHAEHARHLERRRRIDRHDVGVRVGRAHERRVGLIRRIEVVGVASLTRQETIILASPDRRADTERGHGLQNSRHREREWSAVRALLRRLSTPRT